MLVTFFKNDKQIFQLKTDLVPAKNEIVSFINNNNRITYEVINCENVYEVIKQGEVHVITSCNISVIEIANQPEKEKRNDNISNEV